MLLPTSRKPEFRGRPFRTTRLFRILGFILACSVLSARAQEFRKEDENLVIRSYKGDLRKANPEGGFIIDLISGNADLKANGSIRIGRVDGNLVAATSAGNIEIRDVAGNVTAITQAGNISVEKALRHIYAQAELGEILIRSANSAEVQNIFGGDVKIFNVLGRSKVVTKGNILLVVPEANTSEEICNLSSTDGDITIYLPEATDADLEIRTPLSEDAARESRIESDFSFSQFRQKCDTGKILTLSTKINKGGRKIILFIEKGNVYLRLLKPESQRSPGFMPG